MQDMNESVKDSLLIVIENLPYEKVKELLDFAEFLLTKKTEVSEMNLDPNKDPLLEFIGLGDVESFSDKIDEELYGN
jgi:hypothetical protein